VGLGGAGVLAGVFLGADPADVAASTATSAWRPLSPWRRRLKEQRVSMTLSGWPWRWVRSPGRSRYASTRTRSFSKTTR
jgi:hypothetical protein